MFRYLLMALLLAASAPVCAHLSPEVGIGFAHATARHNGTWYQQAFAYRLRLNKPSILVGMRYDTGHWTAHLDAVWLSTYSSDAWAVTSDANYNPGANTCNGSCLPLAHYMGHGWAGGVKLTGGWHTSGPWQFGVQAGPMAFREAWRLSVPDWYSATIKPDGTWSIGPIIPVHTSDQHWTLGWTVGTSVTHGRWSLNLDWYRDGKSFNGHAGIWPPIWRWHTVLSVGMAF